MGLRAKLAWWDWSGTAPLCLELSICAAMESPDSGGGGGGGGQDGTLSRLQSLLLPHPHLPLWTISASADALGSGWPWNM